ncbi:replication protein RepA [Acidisphaera sp. L21]|uniref:replication protein RepA n=1 Tax=Acidisphaera sp. L21 TaxID=1641851 RepID=UPI0030055A54
MHQLIEAKGKQGALAADLDREQVEAAAAYLADEQHGVGFLYSGWCQAALPHRKLPDAQGWQITGDHVTLIVEPGMRPSPTGIPEPIGVPYGSRARLIMLYMQSEALRTCSREIELGRSLRAWLYRMGIPSGGKSIAAVREQAERLSACRLTLRIKVGKTTGLINQNIVDTAIFLDSGEERQPSLFAETAKLSEGFYEQLSKHSVPLEEAAIRAINNNSMALDIYAWLAYRLHSLEKPCPITWLAIKAQFGNGFGDLKNFRKCFVSNLKLALAVYPAARVDCNERGVILHPARPPVATTNSVPRLLRL